GGATKATWSFTAAIGAEKLPLVLQLASPRPALAPGDPLAELPRVVGADEGGSSSGRARTPCPPRLDAGGWAWRRLPHGLRRRRDDCAAHSARAPIRAASSKLRRALLRD